MNESGNAAVDKRLGSAPVSNGPRDRSMAEVVKDIIGNVQEIVRGEVRLASREAKQVAIRGMASARMLAVGAVVGLFAGVYLLLAVVYALAMVMPNWAAAATVGVMLAIAAGATVSAGLGKWKQAQQRSGESIERIGESLHG